MGKLKAALFDLDGTLFDTEDQYTVIWGKIARRFRPDIPHLEYIIKGTTLKQIFERYFPDPEVQKQIDVIINEEEANMHYDFVAGAREFIDDLRAHGVRCAVVTSSNTIKMNSVARQMPAFSQLFDRVLTAEDFKASKPDPDCYLLGARVFGCELDECVVFEDALTGLQAGMSSGIYTIGLATTRTKEEIADKCHHVIDNFIGFDYNKCQQLINSRNL